jgi:dTDP-4-amino-4,6-dideoxygalactose transaminase
MPCDVHALQRIADRHGLRVVYDAAHAFGTELDGTPITAFGDASAYSFHATKLFHTAEGGAVVSRSAELRERVDLLRNFGIRNETTVELPGINGKMNELQAALGLCNLELIEAERSARAEIADVYTARLGPRLGIRCVRPPSGVRDSRQYFAVRITGGAGRRDAMYDGLKRFNVFSRRYFYPLCSDYEFYRQLPSARADLLPTSRRAAAEVLCLPYFGGLGADGAHRICDMIEHIIGEGRVSTP